MTSVLIAVFDGLQPRKYGRTWRPTWPGSLKRASSSRTITPYSHRSPVSMLPAWSQAVIPAATAWRLIR